MKLYQSNRHKSSLSKARPVRLIKCRCTPGNSRRCGRSAVPGIPVFSDELVGRGF